MAKIIFKTLEYKKREKLYRQVKKDTDILKRLSKDINELADTLSVEYGLSLDVMKKEIASVLSEHIECMY